MQKKFLLLSTLFLLFALPFTIFSVSQNQDNRSKAAASENQQTAVLQAMAPTLITPTIYCVGGVGSAPCATMAPTSTTAPTNGASTSPSTAPPTGVTNPTGGASTPYPSVDPCNTDSSNSVMHNKKKKKFKQGRGGGFFERFFKFIFWFIQYILRGGSVPAPTDPGTPNPCPEPTTEPQPTTQPTGGAQPTQDPTPTTFGTTTAPTVSPSVSPSTGSGTQATVKITFYGSYDNDPKGSKAIANPVIHQEAGGTGSYEDPLTFASPAGPGEYAFGQKIYVPRVQKYFIREDECAVSWTAPDGCGAVTMVDLYVGNPSDSESVIQCEESLTPSGNEQIIIDPPANLAVDPNPIWNQATGTCMSPKN